jgi:septal ring factor EnvC (AmiA/AmiB activator)
LIAEDVVEANPELTVRDKAGELLTVRYDAVNAMLLNEFLKEHRRVEELKSTIAQQRQEFQTKVERQDSEIRALIATVKEQAARIQKVSAQVEARKPRSQTLAENR